MARLLNLCGLLLATAMFIFATPAPQNYVHACPPAGHPQYFFLRANCPDEPWHGRRLVSLPTSHQLGLENFTIHPETSPLRFRPIHIANTSYALQGERVGDDPSKIPYLAALKSVVGTRTASMAIVYIPKPTSDAFEANPDACPTGYVCVTDQWTFGAAGNDMVHPGFQFAGFKGSWMPFKDAGTEGWHVYWKGNAGLAHPIELELVPVDGDEDCRRFDGCSH